MRINIVTEGRWIKRFWSDKIAEAGHPEMEFTVSETPTDDADVNFHIDYNMFLHFPKSKILDVGYVTHLHKNDPQEHSRDMCLPFGRFTEMDMFIHQSQRSIEQWRQLGFTQPSHLLRNAIDTSKFRRTVRLGILQNGGCPGKGLDFMNELVRSFDLTNFKIIFCGKDWEPTQALMQERGYRYEQITLTHEQYYASATSQIYEHLHYLLIPSRYEGGPVCAVEAAHCGIPVISSDVGLVPELKGSLLFPAGDVEALADHLDDIQTRHYTPATSFPQFNQSLFSILSSL